MNKENLSSFILFTVILTVSIYYLFDSENSIQKIESSFTECKYENVITNSNQLLKYSNLDKHQKSRLYILKAASEFMLNQNLNSQLTFIELLKNDRTVALNEKELSPQIVSLFNKIKENINQLE